MQMCLTCKLLSRYTIDTDLRGKKFYGDWMYCICPFNPGPAGKPIPTADFVLKHRRKTMTFYTATTRIVLQEHDEANKTALIEHIGSFPVEAEDLDNAVVKARELLPDDYFILIGVEEIVT